MDHYLRLAHCALVIPLVRDLVSALVCATALLTTSLLSNPAVLRNTAEALVAPTTQRPAPSAGL